MHLLAGLLVCFVSRAIIFLAMANKLISHSEMFWKVPQNFLEKTGDGVIS